MSDFTPTATVICGDSRTLDLPDASVHCCVTSPPYFNLRDYNGEADQIGAEPDVMDYLWSLVSVFREVKRVLRDDGTLWLNLGDTTNAYNGNRGPSTSFSAATERALPRLPGGSGLLCKALKPKDLIGIPWMVAFALRRDGWYLRSEVIWHKPNPMPESAIDRPGRAHETMFLLAKSRKYFYDYFPVRTAPDGTREGCHLRDVWTIPVKGFKGAHFATFPPGLVEPCIKAGTSEHGVCPTCFAPWTRVVRKLRRPSRPGKSNKVDATGMANRDAGRHVTEYIHEGWKQGCPCEPLPPIPATVLDPFAGAFTTGRVARRLGRSAIGYELNAEYCQIARNALDDDLNRRPVRARRRKPSWHQLPLEFAA